MAMCRFLNCCVSGWAGCDGLQLTAADCDGLRLAAADCDGLRFDPACAAAGISRLLRPGLSLLRPGYLPSSKAGAFSRLLQSGYLPFSKAGACSSASSRFPSAAGGSRSRWPEGAKIAPDRVRQASGGRIPAPPCLSDGRRCGATPSGPSVRRCSAARRRRGCPRRARRGWWCGCRGPSARRGSGASPRRRARRRATRGCGGSG